MNTTGFWQDEIPPPHRCKCAQSRARCLRACVGVRFLEDGMGKTGCLFGVIAIIAAEVMLIVSALTGRYWEITGELLITVLFAAALNYATGREKAR